MSGAIYGGAPEEEASAPAASEDAEPTMAEPAAEPPEESASEPPPSEPPPPETTAAAPPPEQEEEAKPPPPPPPPQTPEKKVRASITKTFFDPEGEIRNIGIRSAEGGCKQVQVGFSEQAPGLTTEYQMEQVYRATYGHREMGANVCGVTVTAIGTLVDDFGQETETQLYSTSIGRGSADRVNWDKNSQVNFRNVWKVNYIDPTMEQAIAVEEAEIAADCAVDEGIFDNWLCP